MGNWYRWEIRQLKEFKKIIILLKGEISYGNTTLPDAIKLIAKKNTGEFSEFLLVLKSEIKKEQGVRFQSIWENAIFFMINSPPYRLQSEVPRHLL